MELAFKNILTNIYYLSILIDKSLSFKYNEKIKIFTYAKSNNIKILKLIKVFENEQKGIDFIKSDYKNNLNKIGKDFKKDLEKGIIDKERKNRKNIRNTIKNMKIIELEEKKNENLDNLLTNI